MAPLALAARILSPWSLAPLFFVGLLCAVSAFSAPGWAAPAVMSASRPGPPPRAATPAPAPAPSVRASPAVSEADPHGADPSAAQAAGAPGEVRVLRLARGAVRVRVEPRPRAAERGFVMGPDAAFPLLESRRAPGCRQAWHRIGPQAWLCDHRLVLGRGQPTGAVHPRLREDRSMPHQYMVNQHSQKELQRPAAGAPSVRTLRQGSGFIVRPLVTGEGGSYRRTRLGYLPAQSLRMVRPSDLQGVVLDGNRGLPISWVSGATAWMHSTPSQAATHRVGGLKAYTQVTVEETRKVGRVTYVRVGPHRWVHGDRVRTARHRARPKGVEGDARWIHVSLRDWTLVAYEGTRPVYAALISRGFNTPRGQFTITKKVALRTLRFETRQGEVEMEAVPWVMYFKPRFAFHSAYWHDGFGERASTGCVNLSPADARWLFAWATPHLLPGWHELSTLPSDPVTHVLIE